MPSVVVTGVSSGIGWGTAKVLLQHGFQVFGSVRKREDADRLSAAWGEAFTPLLFDITDEQAVKLAAALGRASPVFQLDHPSTASQTACQCRDSQPFGIEALVTIWKGE